MKQPDWALEICGLLGSVGVVPGSVEHNQAESDNSLGCAHHLQPGLQRPGAVYADLLTGDPDNSHAERNAKAAARGLRGPV